MGGTKRVIYVAGPYNAAGRAEVLDNIMRARDYARKLWAMGWVVLCPHANSGLMDGEAIPDSAFVEGSLELMLRCDAVLMIPGWENSKGARAELEAAIYQGMDVYYEMGTVPDLMGRV